jgi:hypothetical protein
MAARLANDGTTSKGRCRSPTSYSISQVGCAGSGRATAAIDIERFSPGHTVCCPAEIVVARINDLDDVTVRADLRILRHLKSVVIRCPVPLEVQSPTAVRAAPVSVERPDSSSRVEYPMPRPHLVPRQTRQRGIAEADCPTCTPRPTAAVDPTRLPRRRRSPSSRGPS